YYGAAFTGSTDVMAALASTGVSTVLFLNVPTPELLTRFRDCRALGIAGTSRSETPAWLQEHLARAFEWLHSLGADICHSQV
ncbi:four-carbon acid sugar kinase family protein, partial [Rhizobium ruizarguesonis]